MEGLLTILTTLTLGTLTLPFCIIRSDTYAIYSVLLVIHLHISMCIAFGLLRRSALRPDLRAPLSKSSSNYDICMSMESPREW